MPDLEPEFAEALIDLVSARYPLSEDHPLLQEICPELIYQGPGDEWVFFAGTFNPWHRGHQSCLDLLPEEKVCFILTDKNPRKELNYVHPVACILDMGHKVKFKKNQFLVPTFLLKSEKNPTVEWIEKLKKNFPAQKLSLLMGFDSFSQIQSWIRASDLLKNLHCLYVVSRLENRTELELAEAAMNKFEPKVKIQFLGNHLYENLSSTQIREQNRREP